MVLRKWLWHSSWFYKCPLEEFSGNLMFKKYKKPLEFKKYQFSSIVSPKFIWKVVFAYRRLILFSPNSLETNIKNLWGLKGVMVAISIFWVIILSSFFINLLYWNHTDRKSNFGNPWKFFKHEILHLYCNCMS